MFDIEKSLKKVALNLWCEWNPEVHELFKLLSPYVWKLFRRNLHRFLTLQDENFLLYRYRLIEMMQDERFVRLFNQVWQQFESYLNDPNTPVRTKYPQLADKTVAYFSMEYGFDTLPIYSGGLGVLSGDHLRGASDLGLPLVGVGLFYIQGYYRQQINRAGQMKVSYESVVPPNQQVKHWLPLKPVKKAGTDADLVIEVPMRSRMVKARVWKVHVGRVQLLLLDTNLRDNTVHDRHISRRLYASQKHREDERRRRLEQEILLGLGGVKALIGAGYKPEVYHLNEGHVAFAAIEVIRNLMANGLSFAQAKEKAAHMIGFTTHTPVPEGNERFDERLVRDHLNPYLSSFLSHGDQEIIYNCARNTHDEFDMTKLSLLLSGVYRNAVSKLHGEVCRKMWGYAWAIHDPAQVPIGHITNGVHVPYWQKKKLRDLIKQIGGPERIFEVPDLELWQLHKEFKQELIEKARERFAYQFLRSGEEARNVYSLVHKILSEDAFFMGFARRFAQYKRVTFILDDEEYFFDFLERSYRKYQKPIHLLFAGKPHPDNLPGRQSIQHIYEAAKRLETRCKERNFEAQIVFIQSYDINLARFLEAGVDIWLNNPIRPMEASGTSGMKAGINGVLNISVSDGWVPEGIEHGKNGWLFGQGDLHSEDQDRKELIRLLEDEVLPVYFDRKGNPNFSVPWLKMMKQSIATITKKFNTDRMLEEYIQKMYFPAVQAEKILPSPITA